MKKILLIEDDAKHIEDAKTVLVNNIEVTVDFASTYLEAKKLMDENKYAGIISDIFFPYAEETSYTLKGWSLVARNECEQLLEEALAIVRSSDDRRWITAAYKWMEGSEMHPTGVMIVDRAVNNIIPIVLCTDTYHHGNSTEPVNIWSRKHKVEIFDGYPKGNAYEGKVDTKDWAGAIKRLLAEIEHGLKGYELSEKLREIAIQKKNEGGENV
jgi:CheY-like chemotaxis protein